ncbi:MAG: hypothetical protein K5640_07000 [Treponema sp.]|nr:hypothetical protein [Treponema sp.]
MRRIMVLFCVTYILLFSFAVYMIIGLYHDFVILEQNNASMRTRISEMNELLEENKKDIRQVKTDSDLVFRMVVAGEYTMEE